MTDVAPKSKANQSLSSNQPLSVAIIHGWAEGEWQSRHFRQQLEQAGYQPTTDIKNADAIIAHSSGCFQVPEDTKARLILLIGLPYWPNRPLITSLLGKLHKEITHHRKNQQLNWWMNKLLHNTWYIFSRPQASIKVFTKHKLSNLPNGNQRKVILIRPSDDTFTTPNIKQCLNHQPYQFIELEGSHDECWIQPQSYIQLLRDTPFY